MISVIVPAYKKTDLLVKNLKQNLKFLDGCEVIVVNDFPRKSIKNNLRGLRVKLIENRENLGFGGAVNEGVKNAKYKYVFLLNSDAVLNDRSFIKSLDRFKKNPQLFAVGFAQKEKGNLTVGRNLIYWKEGFLLHQRNPKNKFGKNAWAEGGASIFDKNKFQFFGGFDTLYSPFYWEDIDLSYRAWKAGFEVLYEPKTVIDHQHESTIGAYFTPSHVKKIAYRNQIIFTWKNITDHSLMFDQAISIIPHFFVSLFKGDIAYVLGFFSALWRLPRVLYRRSNQKSLYKLTDNAVINLFR